MKRCKSGLHEWEERSTAIEKCCNGFVPLWVPVKNAGYMQLELDEGNLDPFKGRAGRISTIVFVPDHETERIARLRALEPRNLRKMWRGEPN